MYSSAIFFIIPVSSPIGMYCFPDASIFSTKVEPHLGTPIIKIGFTLLVSLSLLKLK